MSEIKPCPFCGTKHPEVYFDDEGTFTVECQECGGMFVSPTSKDRAAVGWNNRQVEQKLLDALDELNLEQQAEIERLQAMLREARELLDSLPKASQSFDWFHWYKRWLASAGFTPTP